MINRLKKHIDKHFSFTYSHKQLIGLSGGLDSIVLAHILKVLGLDIALAHVNFSLRGKESDKDEFFVMQWAQENNLALFRTKLDTIKESEDRKISIEMAARDLRYDWFNSLLEKYEFDFITVAHHLNDNVETVLMNLSRGTGITGITGMKDISGNIFRPLLPFSRKEILNYAQTNNLKWREDLSNLDTVYKRNKIRHELVPLFEELNPSFLESFSKNIANFKQTELIQNEYMLNVSSDFWKEKDEVIEIYIPELKKLTAFKTVLRERLLPYNFKNIDDIIEGLDSTSGKAYFSSTHRIVKYRDKLLLSSTTIKTTSEFIIKENISFINFPIKLYVNNVDELQPNTDKNTAHFDKSKLKFPLKLRKWRDGDFFYPFGMNGKKN